MTGHKVITVERGGGYAARCEEPGCGAITFGGFPSRTAARAALLGHEFDANPEPHTQPDALTMNQPAFIPSAAARVIRSSSQAGIQTWIASGIVG